MKSFVIDASALMTFLDGRPGAAQMERLLNQAAQADLPMAMSVVNWGEVYYSIWKARGRAAADQKLREIGQLPLDLIDVDAVAARIAARFKAERGLPYADCFAAALAEQRRATVVTSDYDFRAVEKDLRILWAVDDDE